jgi:CRISPR-associated protein Cmr1
MTANQRLDAPPPIVRRSDEALGLVREARDYQLITPLFGGGAEPQKADAVTVVRGSEVRAHLRFWWRAMRGGAFGGDLAKMKAREDEIFGAPANTDNDGKKGKPTPTVQLAITVTDPGRPLQVLGRSGKHKGQPVNVGAPESPYGYAAFPLYQTDKNSYVLDGVKFTLNLTYAQGHADDVAAALWGWETFGGIGARTRRGFGALTCTNIEGSRPISPERLGEWLDAQVSRHAVKGKWPESVPSPQYGTLRLAGVFDTSLAAWEHLISKLREFRQYRIDKHTGKRSPFGRSVWPEPREIRRLVALPKGRKATGAPTSGEFPRAVFGLPIIFQFMRDDPIDQVTLKPDKYDRLASPLILKPLQCANGKSVALAVLLKTPALPPGSHLELDGHHVASQLSPADAAAIPPLNSNQDVLGAFLAWLVRKDR